MQQSRTVSDQDCRVGSSTEGSTRSSSSGEGGGGVCSRRGKVGSGGQGMGAGSNPKDNRSDAYGADAEKGGQARGRQW